MNGPASEIEKAQEEPCMYTKLSWFAPYATVIAILVLGGFYLYGSPARAAGGGEELKHVDWSFEGVFGTYDTNQIRRGYKVYKQVCASCHGLKYLYYRNLTDPAGPAFTEGQAVAIAEEYEVEDGPNSDGDMFMRPAKLTDRFKEPFANEEIAKLANNGAVPPDLSLMAKARMGGANYIYSLLTGYEDAPAGEEMLPGLYYNKYFPGHAIAMAPPLIEGILEYEEPAAEGGDAAKDAAATGDAAKEGDHGSDAHAAAPAPKATVEQMSKDVSAFLMWAAEPHLPERKRTGFVVMLYLAILAGLLYFTTRKLWANLH